jgi:hypothetical protein
VPALLAAVTWVVWVLIAVVVVGGFVVMVQVLRRRSRETLGSGFRRDTVAGILEAQRGRPGGSDRQISRAADSLWEASTATLERLAEVAPETGQRVIQAGDPDWQTTRLPGPG